VGKASSASLEHLPPHLQLCVEPSFLKIAFFCHLCINPVCGFFFPALTMRSPSPSAADVQYDAIEPGMHAAALYPWGQYQ